MSIRAIRFSSFLLFFFSGLALAQASVDPRILERIRNEDRQFRNFCFSFVQDGLPDSTEMANDCFAWAGMRKVSNDRMAQKVPGTQNLAPLLAQDHSRFCATIEHYTLPGSGVGMACQAWNRSRADLFRLTFTPGTSTGTLSAQIDRVRADRVAFCQFVRMAGSRGRPEAFYLRVNSCWNWVPFSTQVDLALVLGQF